MQKAALSGFFLGTIIVDGVSGLSRLKLIIQGVKEGFFHYSLAECISGEVFHRCFASVVGR